MSRTETATRAGAVPRAARPRLHPRVYLRFAVALLVQPLALFAAAGDLAWASGWLYLALFLGLTLVGRLLVFARHPGLMAERGGALDRADVPALDKLLVAVITVLGPVALVIVAGLDHRFGWSPALPLGLTAAAACAVVAAMAFGTWAMWVNPFFSAVVRIQRERGQTVITTGPYRIIRHPGYASAILADAAAPLVLGSLPALVAAALLIAALVVRTIVEDRTLLAELPGYRDYAARTCRRLLPGVW